MRLKVNNYELIWNYNTKLFDIVDFSDKEFPKGKIVKSISKALLTQLALSTTEITKEEINAENNISEQKPNSESDRNSQENC
jgi:hypothetical protein